MSNEKLESEKQWDYEPSKGLQIPPERVETEEPTAELLQTIQEMIAEHGKTVQTIAIPFADEGYLYVSHWDNELALKAARGVLKEIAGYYGGGKVKYGTTPTPECENWRELATSYFASEVSRMAKHENAKPF